MRPESNVQSKKKISGINWEDSKRENITKGEDRVIENPSFVDSPNTAAQSHLMMQETIMSQLIKPIFSPFPELQY